MGSNPLENPALRGFYYFNFYFFYFTLLNPNTRSFMSGYYGDGRTRTTPTQTMHYNGRTYYTGQKVIIKHLLFKPYKEMRKNYHTGEMFEASGISSTGEYVEVEGIITGFEANWRARPSIKYITPESDHYAGKIVHGLMSYSDFTTIR